MTTTLYQKIKNAYILPSYTPYPALNRGVNLLLEHLVNANAADYIPEIEPGVPSFTPLQKATPAQTLNAQIKTSDWMQEITGEDEVIIERAQEEKAIDVFSAMLNDAPEAKTKLLQMQVPEEIRSTVAMVSAYQWKFVEQAENLRNMAVTKIVEETNHPDARIRLKALEMLGKVTEVALFTDRVEVKRTEMTDDELSAQIKNKLSRYMGKVDIVDVRAVEVEGGEEE